VGTERPEPGRDTAGRTLEEQAAEIERLRAQLAANPFADALRGVMLATAETGVIGAPLPHGDVLQAIVETAASVLEAEAGALFLVDDQGDELVFQVALGGKAEKVKHFRVPVGHGIAGYVAATGQPLAVAQAENDPRFAREIGEAIDYRPSTILCVPLFLRERVVGVLELLNKAAGVPFSPRDMEILGRFGRLAALAIDQSRLAQDMRHLFRSLLGEVVRDGPLAEPARRFAELTADHAQHTAVIRLAGLVHELSRRDDRTQQLALEILTSVTQYLVARERLG
jgi:GAF domain-containing protein